MAFFYAVYGLWNFCRKLLLVWVLPYLARFIRIRLYN